MTSLNYLVRILILLCLTTGITQAQDFNKTIGKLDLNNREQKEFSLFKRTFPDSATKKLQYGIQIGANVSDLLGDTEGTSTQVGYVIGGFARYDINRKWSVQAEISYSREGAQQDGDSLGTGLALDSGLAAASKYNYVSVPLSVRFYPLEDYGFYLTGGPHFSYLVHAELQGTGGEFSLTSDDRIDIADRLNKVDLGAHLGVGFTWAKMLDVTVRYKYSFTNTVDNNHSRTISDG
ncbi:MAG: porin family protein, partial [Flammeovirgaceae bacterium]